MDREAEAITKGTHPDWPSSLPSGFMIEAPADLPRCRRSAHSEWPASSRRRSSVNEEVDRIAKSANKNLIEPALHPIDTAVGLGKLAAGAAQYAGVPGEGFKPNVDALLADYAKTYGSLGGLKDALINDPVRVAMDASMAGGLLGKAGRAAGITARRPAHIAAPTTEELFDQADQHYDAMHNYRLELHPHVMERTAFNIEDELKSQGYRDYLAPKTFRAIEELRNPDGATMTTQEVEGVRRALGQGPQAIPPKGMRPVAPSSRSITRWPGFTRLMPP